MIEQMNESKRIELIESAEGVRMYGPALMGLPLRNGHLVALIPTLGMVLEGNGRTITIQAVEYDVTRNRVACTCETAGKQQVMGWDQIIEHIEAGRVRVAKNENC